MTVEIKEDGESLEIRLHSPRGSVQSAALLTFAERIRNGQSIKFLADPGPDLEIRFQCDPKGGNGK